MTIFTSSKTLLKTLKDQEWIENTGSNMLRDRGLKWNFEHFVSLLTLKGEGAEEKNFFQIGLDPPLSNIKKLNHLLTI